MSTFEPKDRQTDSRFHRLLRAKCSLRCVLEANAEGERPSDNADVKRIKSNSKLFTRF